MQEIVPHKSPSSSVYFADIVSFIRAFIYSLVCGKNSVDASQAQFLAACNRFGLDNPCPIITKRLSNYGNAEDVEKDFKRLAEKFRVANPDVPIDPDIYASCELKHQAMDIDRYKKVYEFNETKAVSPLKKFSGIANFNIITTNNSPTKGSEKGLRESDTLIAEQNR